METELNTSTEHGGNSFRWDWADFEDALEGLAPQVLRSSVTLGLFDCLAEGPKSIEELSKALALDQTALMLLVNFLVARGVLDSRQEKLLLTRFSVQLLSSHRSMAAKWLHEDGPGRMLNQAFDSMSDSVRTGMPAFRLKHGADFYGTIKDSYEAFTPSRGEYGRTLARKLIDSQALDGVEELMDVGGGDGSFILEVLHERRNLYGKLIDLPGTASKARASRMYGDVADRLSISEQSFFDPLPKTSGAIVLSNVLHNWNDSDAKKLIGNVATSLAEGSSVFVIETCLDDLEPAPATSMALRMYLLCGGIERTRIQYEVLFQSANLIPVGSCLLSNEIRLMEFRARRIAKDLS
ncbi:acetylserotonin O-methyltransferase [Corynebacterium cystitidis]|uniref:acetylserotonin O-methyltransferase n=1 Tax=Corynebacterium cystitidis TaxID=35757 RepID=UPI00211E9B80|nr:acetylserotonin O-methyltransferase [Corynebacterium cystitidis]